MKLGWRSEVDGEVPYRGLGRGGEEGVREAEHTLGWTNDKDAKPQSMRDG